MRNGATPCQVVVDDAAWNVSLRTTISKSHSSVRQAAFTHDLSAQLDSDKSKGIGGDRPLPE